MNSLRVQKWPRPLASPLQAFATRLRAQLSSGQIKKVDKDTGKLSIEHGPLTNLNMPAMTMIFKAQDSAMLGQVRTGDKIRFRAEQINGVFTVIKLGAAQYTRRT